MILHPLDRVQIAVEAPIPGFLTVIGIESTGDAEVYFDSLATKPGQFTVPDSLVLDDYIGKEKWYIIVAENPVPAEQYLEKIRKNNLISEPVIAITFTKEKAL